MTAIITVLILAGIVVVEAWVIVCMDQRVNALEARLNRVECALIDGTTESDISRKHEEWRRLRDA